MKLLVAITNYGNSQENYLRRIIEEYYNMSFDVDIIIDTTYEIEFENKYNNIIKQYIYPESIGQYLVFEHRKHMKKNCNDYDFFIYVENDHLITEENINEWIKITNNLPENYVTGFIQYEESDIGKFDYLPGYNPACNQVITERNIELNGKKYFTIHNMHQGCWMLTKNQLSKIVNEEKFCDKTCESDKYQGYGVLENGASNIFYLFGFNRKVLPYENLEKLLIHHLPNKYLKLDGWWKSAFSFKGLVNYLENG